jgi:GT2 family glycosyltransferase
MNKTYSLIVVSYKSKNDIEKMIESLSKVINKNDFEIIISDNFEKNNETVQKSIRHGIETIHVYNNKNVGYATGVNNVLKHCSGKYIVIVNPDITFKDDKFFEKFPNHLKDSTIGAISCKLLNEDGSVQTSFRKFPKPFQLIEDFISLKLGSKKPKGHFYDNYDNITEPTIDVDWFSGGFLAVRKTEKLFDERYFMYFEDVDLCRKLKENGKRRVVLTKCEISHKAAYESRNIFSKTFRYHVMSMIKYFLKWGI